MSALALLIAILALVVAVAAYRRTGGMRDLNQRLEVLSENVAPLRDKAADQLDKLSDAVRQHKDDGTA